MWIGVTGGGILESEAWAMCEQSGMETMDGRLMKIDVSDWSLEQVHDALASHARNGWELNRVTGASSGRMVLWLVLREVA